MGRKQSAAATAKAAQAEATARHAAIAAGFGGATRKRAEGAQKAPRSGPPKDESVEGSPGVLVSSLDSVGGE